MSRLELKVPPDVVALVVAGLMWLVAKVTPSFDLPTGLRVLIASALIVSGVALIVAARIDFAREGATFSPVAVDRSSHLVTTGVYRLTRNPMYLGTWLVLIALGVVLSNGFAIVVSGAYVLYVNRFQIRLEERALRARFGSAYEAYANKVRRWA